MHADEAKIFTEQAIEKYKDSLRVQVDIILEKVFFEIKKQALIGKRSCRIDFTRDKLDEYEMVVGKLRELSYIINFRAVHNYMIITW